MFRKNDAHRQEPLFSHFKEMHPRMIERLNTSWAPVFYEHVFCKIDEEPFAVLYCPDNGRPNSPVNVFLALEFIKHWRDYTDEELFHEAWFNLQVRYALGCWNLNEDHVAPRTFYDFRERVYRYALTHPDEEDLIFGQFIRLTENFIQKTGAKTDAQRVDSSLFMSNIQKAGRLRLAFDVLYHAVEACQEELPEELRAVLSPTYKTEVLHRTKNRDKDARLNELLNLGGQLLALAKERAWEDIPFLKILDRFLSEQADYDGETKTWKAKALKDIPANSLQSVHDVDATYRKKGNKAQSGYVVNIAETTSKENLAEFITDYKVAKNTTSDIDMLTERLPELAERTGVKDIYADGGYYGPAVEEVAEKVGVNMHYTGLTGAKPKSGVIPMSEFSIKDRRIIEACPEGKPALSSSYSEAEKKLSAEFDINTCRSCPRREECPVRTGRNKATINISQKKVVADETRSRLEGNKDAISCRAGIEGTNSALKRAQGLDKLNVRGLHKCRVVVGLKTASHNFGQFLRWLQREAAAIKKALVPSPGILVGI